MVGVGVADSGVGVLWFQRRFLKLLPKLMARGGVRPASCASVSVMVMSIDEIIGCKLHQKSRESLDIRGNEVNLSFLWLH